TGRGEAGPPPPVAFYRGADGARNGEGVISCSGQNGEPRWAVALDGLSAALPPERVLAGRLLPCGDTADSAHSQPGPGLRRPSRPRQLDPRWQVQGARADRVELNLDGICTA